MRDDEAPNYRELRAELYKRVCKLSVVRRSRSHEFILPSEKGENEEKGKARPVLIALTTSEAVLKREPVTD